MKDKRVELHLHTNMSTMDGINTASEYIREAKEQGMTAIAITDHGVVQAFPEAYKAAKNNGIKLIYGMEGYFVNDKEQIVFGDSNEKLSGTFVVVNIETTGFDCNKDKITEIAACKVCNKEIIGTFNSLVNPGAEIPKEITELTGITNETAAKSPDVKTVLKQFVDFCGEHTIVAHNARFDIGFINKATKENNINFNPSYLDTLTLSRFLLPEFRCHKLSVLCRELEIENDSEHRAISDSKATAKLFIKFIDMLEEKRISNVSEIDENNDVPYYKGKRYHITILVENEIGLKNLYKLVSKSHTEHFWKRPIILRSELLKYGEGLLYGSACSDGEIYSAILEGRTDEELGKMSYFYNFLEIQPIENSRYLIETGRVADEDELREINKRIVKLAEEHAMIVVADGDVHFLNKEDGECRKIVMHKLGYENYNQPDLRFKSTEEMLEEFSYLGDDKAHEIVVTMPNKLVNVINEGIEPFPQTMQYPKMGDSDERIRMWSYIGARRKYGEHIPDFVEERLKWELEKIKENKFANLYMLASEMVKPSKRNGYVVGNRGSIASSLVAYFLEITEINPLAPHYYCEKCDYSEISEEANCGCDLSDKVCPKCGHQLLKDGFNIPAETFMGAEGDREPDIDLNFAPEIREKAEERLKQIFGQDKIFRAGTISQFETDEAYSCVLNYCKENEISLSDDQINKYVRKIRNVKRKTEVHPGGMYIIPENKAITDYTPVQCSFEEERHSVIISHFDNFDISDRLYKVDIFAHYVPSMLKMLAKMTDVDPEKIPLNDKQTLHLLSAGKTNGVPEFSGPFMKDMIAKTGVECFDDLIRISGLSHGTGTLEENTVHAIENHSVQLSDLISTRDDITNSLKKYGYSKEDAFKISEMVRKGKGLTEEQEDEMYQKGIPEWYIESCNTVKYLFPRAHVATYVLLAYRVAYFKVHYPLEFYCAYFNLNIDKFGVDLFFNNAKFLPEVIEEPICEELNDMIEVCQEMYESGYKFVFAGIKNKKINGFFVEDGMIKPSVR